MADDPVGKALDLLSGMQKLGLVADTVELTAEGVKLTAVRDWAPQGQKLTPDLFDGHGAPP